MKRTESFNFVNKVKKQKLDEDNNKKISDDDIWGDDPEIEEVDKCIDFATQMCSQNIEAGRSLFPSTYDEFKRKDIYSSTQAFIPPNTPSTSKIQQKKQLINYLNSSSSTSAKCANIIVTKDVSEQEMRQQLMDKIKALEIQNKNLQENYETKDGEISILRSQLKQANKTIDHEKAQKFKILEENQGKWSSKFNVASKDITSLKCELELKNLEIMNLKVRITEVQKVYNSQINMSTFSDEMNVSQLDFTKRKMGTTGGTSKTISTKCVQTDKNILTINPRNYDNNFYPFKTAFPKPIYEECEQEMSVITINQDVEDYLRTFEKQDREISLVPLILTEYGKRVSIDYLYPDIYTLVRLNIVELNSHQYVENIKKIIFFTREHLRNMQVKLKMIDELIHERDLEEVSKLYLLQKDEEYPCDCIFSGRSWVLNEAWPETRRCLALTSVIVTYCDVALQYVCGQMDIKASFFDFTELLNKWETINVYPDEDHMKISPTEFLEMLFYITTVIEKIRRSHQFSGVQASILKLLAVISERDKLPTQRYDIIFEIFKNIVFSRPPRSVAKYICEFLNVVSSVDVFMVKLCRNSPSDSFGQEEKNLYYFTEDTCVFQVLSRLMQYSEISLESTLHIIQFFYKTMTANMEWLRQGDNQNCECLTEMYALPVTIIYQCLEPYFNPDKHVADKTLRMYRTVFKQGFIFLNILTRAPMLVYRRMDLNKQYQIIIRAITVLQHPLNLSQTHQHALETTIMMLDRDDDEGSPIDTENKIISFENIFRND